MCNSRWWVVLCLAITASVFASTPASAQASGADPLEQHRALLDSLDQSKSNTGPTRTSLTKDGYLKFLGAPSGKTFGAVSGDPADAAAVATSFLRHWRASFVNPSQSVDFTVTRVKKGEKRSTVRFGQTYQGYPVFGAEVIVQVATSGGIEAVTSDVLTDTATLDGQKGGLMSATTAEEASESAVQVLSSLYPNVELQSSTPELVIYAPTVIGNDGEPALAWKLEITSPDNAAIREQVFIDALTAKPLLHFSLIHHAKNRQIYDSNNTIANPGTLERSEGDPASGITDVDEAYEYFGDTYDFYFNEHGRDSIDNAGYTLSATVRFCPSIDNCPFANAFWNGTRMYFGEGFAAADDVVAHELTHGVTQYESNLVYHNQSGAINESFSDMWGEWVDLSNTGGTDTPGVRWLIGEDIPGIGAFRDMANPPAFGHPDRMNSPYFYTGGLDNGGVHINSGVGNKLCYLLTDGGTFNFRTVTAMGIPAVADLMYECQVNLLTSSSDYGDFYNALTQAAINLGLSQADKDNIEQACLAVEIKELPAKPANFYAESSTANNDIELSWTNPGDITFEEVVIRRSTTGYPLSESDGDLVYQGTGTFATDTNTVQSTQYYYAIFADHGLAGFSYPAYATAIAGDPPTNYWTEQFSINDNDTDNTMFTFTPDNSLSFYSMCAEYTTAFPVTPTGGLVLSLGDDDAAGVSLSGGAEVSFFGDQYNVFYVNSNGNVTFDFPSFDYEDTIAKHFELPRISMLFDDLNPVLGGTIRVQQLGDRAVVTFQGVSEFGAGNFNSFQLEMFFDGVIRITFLGVAAQDGLFGLSQGFGTPPGFTETNFNKGDADDDLLPDCWETANGLDPTVDTGDDGPFGDPDGDGLWNLYEYENGADPQDSDTDDDGLSDGDEVDLHATDPTDSDSDDDGFNDATEVTAGTNPNLNTSYPTTLLWADFAYAGFETGAQSLPFNTLTEAINTVSAGGTIRIYGNTADNTTAESPRITKAVRIEAVGGTVSIGK